MLAALPDVQKTTAASQSSGWRAELDLDFSCSAEQGIRTLLHHRHAGPLRIQKALYPEGPTPCHAIIVHPPGGIAGGDILSIRARIDRAAAALITTPGAAKWYGSSGELATQSISLDVGGDLEWMPQESIVFDAAHVLSSINLLLDPAARMIGWDSLIFGRAASGERFDKGDFHQVIELRRGSRLVWEERFHLRGADPLLSSAAGLSGHVAIATIWAVLREDDQWTEADLEAIRDQCPEMAWTALDRCLLVGRGLGLGLTVRASQQRGWASLRPRVFSRSATPPRVWAT